MIRGDLVVDVFSISSMCVHFFHCESSRDFYPALHICTALYQSMTVLGRAHCAPAKWASLSEQVVTVSLASLVLWFLPICFQWEITQPECTHQVEAPQLWTSSSALILRTKLIYKLPYLMHSVTPVQKTCFHPAHLILQSLSLPLITNFLFNVYCPPCSCT